MAKTRTIQRSFAGGEVTPEFYGKEDDVKFQSGAATLRNFISLPHGPAANRPGFAFVREVKDSTKAVRLIPFSFSSTQTFAIELGAGYFRFHTLGATLLVGSPAAYDNATAYVIGDLVSSGGVNYYCIAGTTGNAPPNATYWYAMPATGEYEIPNPYAEADLFDIHYVQSADIVTLVHPSYAPMELKRYGATNWQLASISFVPDLDAPANVTASATAGSGTTSYSYVVTAIGDNGLDESLASSSDSCTNDLLTTGNKNTITWDAVTGARRYNVYKQSNGLYGYIGQTDGLTFDDDNIAADISKTPPEQNNPFSGAGNYPGAVSYFEQRRCFAGTINKPQNIWMTKSGTESNLSFSLPTRDDDAISFKVRSRQANTIRHLLPMADLIILTSSTESRVTSINTDALTPSSISVRTPSYVGANNVQPILAIDNVIYAAARGGHVRELGYSFEKNGYLSGDLCLRAPHLFDTLTIKDMAYSKAPQPICWFVSSSGDLLGLTYVPEQQVGAWHHHDTTNGVFESVCVVEEGVEDVLYVVIKRTVNGNTVRYVERLASRLFTDQADAFYVDSGLTYDGAPATVITGLDHLEGELVNILADGAVHPQRTVSSGQVTLVAAASKVQVGLPITADLQTLPLPIPVDAAGGVGRQKNINRAFLKVNKSSGIFVGPDLDNLVEFKQRTTEPYGSPPALKSQTIDITLQPLWQDQGWFYVRQLDPLPLTIMSVAYEVSYGG